MSTVLLVVDAQVNMLNDPSQGGVPSSRTIYTNIESLLTSARSAPSHPAIIHVRNCGTEGDPDIPHTPGWELALTPHPDEKIIDKHECNSFEGTNLADYVPEGSTIVVCGMQSQWCIRATCLGALEKGYTVKLVHGAHATYDDSSEVTAQVIQARIEKELMEAGVHLVHMTDDLF